ncbi:antitoxin [Mycobacterium shinjukuense]|uniref:Antitoxin n=1 Tax=Mycobacterium shinjukuense TaxID=398694 RepID=A0A7I7MRS9_9MYCO|nr:antitoxin [Mycobacterium shinjukuense]
MRAAQAVTGQTLRATVERALHQLVAAADERAAERRRRIADHLAHAGTHVDVDVLLSEQAWR